MRENAGNSHVTGCHEFLLRAALLVTFIFVTPVLAPAEAPPALAGPWTGTVNRVVDGDTIVVDVGGLWETIRIIGVDTPETVDPRKPVQAFGQEASDYTKRTLTGKAVKLVADPGNTHIGHRDRYGRMLAYVWVKESLFNEAKSSTRLATGRVHPSSELSC